MLFHPLQISYLGTRPVHWRKGSNFLKFYIKSEASINKICFTIASFDFGGQYVSVLIDIAITYYFIYFLNMLIIMSFKLSSDFRCIYNSAPVFTDTDRFLTSIYKKKIV